MNNDESAMEGRASARPAPEGSFSEEARTCRSTSLQHHWHDRKHPIHFTPVERHNRPIILFITACTKNRRKILASAEAHRAIVDAWKAADAWLVGRYVILPDHVHLFCMRNSIDAPSNERWIRYWKSLVTRALNAPTESIWQRHHWDRQLRRGESYDEKWEYVCANPVRAGLVGKAEDWPYQGELNLLQW